MTTFDRADPSASGLSEAEQSALADYQVTAYRSVNRSLREGRPLDPESQAITDRLDAVIARSVVPADTTVYRGIYPDEQTGEMPDWVRPGAEFSDPAFTSTSTDEDYVRRVYADAESGGVLMVITVPAGAHGVGLTNTAAPESGATSTFGAEGELLLGRGARFRVLDRIPSDDPAKPDMLRVEVVV